MLAKGCRIIARQEIDRIAIDERFAKLFRSGLKWDHNCNGNLSEQLLVISEDGVLGGFSWHNCHAGIFEFVDGRFHTCKQL